MFRFANPQYLWLLLAVPALAFTPYTAYSYDIYGHSTPSANGYEVTAAYAVREFGLTGTPVRMVVRERGDKE